MVEALGRTVWQGAGGLALAALMAGATAGATAGAGSGETGWTAVEGSAPPAAELCAGAREQACLRFSCAGDGGALELSFVEPGTLPGFGRLQVLLAIDGAEARELSVALDPTAPHRQGTVALAPEETAQLGAALGAGSELALSHTEGTWRVGLEGSEEAFAALALACAPAPLRGKEPTPLAELQGQVPVVLDRDAWENAPGTVKALVIGAHGWRTTHHIRLFGTRPHMVVAKAFAAGAGRYLLVAELCGEGDFFGPDGCGIYVSSKTEGRWSVVTVRPAGTALVLDLDRRGEDGWPEILASDGHRWIWRDDAYQPSM